MPISVTKQAAWANQSSKVDKFRHIPHQRYTGLQYNYYLMVKKSTVAFQPSLNTVANLYTIIKKG
jgi:flavorubredoxin